MVLLLASYIIRDNLIFNRRNNAIVVVVLAPAADKICESFTHNPLTGGQGKPTFLSLMGINKECIANASKSESNFGGGNNGCTCITMGK